MSEQIPLGGPAIPPSSASGTAVLALGFRPFFLLAGLGAVALLGVWLAAWRGVLPAPAAYGPLGWHGHEMLFGYAGAVIAGFLLTAVRNWTGIDTPTGPALAGIALVWLLGRLLPWLPAPAWLTALSDVAFFPVLALALARPLMRGRNRVNRLFLPLLLAMALANGLVQAETLGLGQGLASRGRELMLDLILLLLLIVAGRVMPFFTERALPGAKAQNRPAVETAGFALLIALAAADLLLPGSRLGGTLAGMLAMVQAARLLGWHDPRVWHIPILWVLFTGYLWLIAGLLLKGAAAWVGIPPNTGVHALTIGCVGVMTFGMMARVSLGHSGRAMVSAPATNLGFVALNLAAATRVVGPLAYPHWYAAWVLASGLLWILAFALFLWIYAPILWRPRLDGRPG